MTGRYWTYQLAGWTGYSAIGITINLLNGGHLGPLLTGHAILISSGIGLTHLFRREIKRRRPAEQPLSGLWPFLAAGTVLISLVLAALVIGTNIAVGHGNWSPTAVFGLSWGMLFATGVWTILYVRFTERRGYSAREARLQLALREAELRALEAQINPHFLFNSLNSIRALVVLDPPRAQDMVTRLANVLRNSLRHDREHTVQLAAEIEAVADYLALEAIRFEDRLRSEIAIQPDAAACALPPMLLQTLVENAIKHGIARATGGGDLIIRALRQNEFVRLEVENTGRLAAAETSPPQLGLANIRDRLRLLYGDRASLRLEDADGRVKATVLLPAVA